MRLSATDAELVRQEAITGFFRLQTFFPATEAHVMKLLICLQMGLK